MDEVIKYVCHDCHHWWAASLPYGKCPYCAAREIGRIYLESEEAAMLAALVALTFERDEARKTIDELVVMVKKSQEERDYNKNTALNNAQAAVSWMDKCTSVEKERDMKADALSEYARFEDALITAMGYDPDNCALSTSDMAEICEIVRISRIPKDIDTIYRNLQFMHAQEDAEKYKAERDDARRWARHYRRLYEATQKAAPFVADEQHITRQRKGPRK